jgi:hypothetical protein
MVSPSAQVAAAAAVVERALAEAGFRLEQSPMEYRPAEPEGIHRVPRAVHRVGLNDPNAGWVLIYDLRQSEAAAQAGRDFATYLGSGFGQTNYPFDAQFTLNQIGGALVFSWWSRERSPDPDAAEAAFEAIKVVGQPIEVRP